MYVLSERLISDSVLLLLIITSNLLGRLWNIVVGVIYKYIHLGNFMNPIW